MHLCPGYVHGRVRHRHTLTLDHTKQTRHLGLFMFFCFFQVVLWFLSDSFDGTQPSRCASFLLAVWKTSAHIHKMTLSMLMRLLVSSALQTKKPPKTSCCDTIQSRTDKLGVCGQVDSWLWSSSECEDKTL